MGVTNQADLTRLALRALEEAVAEARYGVVERKWGHRLALTWLRRAGIAQTWQAKDFWQRLADQPDEHRGPQMWNYARNTLLIGMLDNWHYAAGQQPPDIVWRQQLAHEAEGRIDAGVITDQAWPMCNRYQPGERQRIEKLFGARPVRAFNAGPETVHPRDPGWVIRRGEDGLVLDQMSWGFPVTLRGKSGKLLKPKAVNNARFDKLGAYWRQWAERPIYRCLIPATRFAEAVGPSGRMTETWLSVKNQEIFAWAGLWRDSDEWGTCYSGVMTDAAPELMAIHDRCPVILTREDWEPWLTAPLTELRQFDRAWPASDIQIEATDQLWARKGGATQATLLDSLSGRETDPG